MADFSRRFSSSRQDWATPQSLFAKVDQEFSFTLDAAASDENTKVLDSYFTEKDNAFSKSWGNNTVWLNPPYGGKNKSLQEWVRKAYKESCSGATVVMLIPARTNTNWFHDLALGKGEVRFVRGRPKFGDVTHGLPQPLCYVIFRPNLKDILSTTPARNTSQIGEG